MGDDEDLQCTDALSHHSSTTSLAEENSDYSELNPLDMVDVRDMLVRDTAADAVSTDSAVGSSVSTINSSALKPTSSLVSKVSLCVSLKNVLQAGYTYCLVAILEFAIGLDTRSSNNDTEALSYLIRLWSTLGG